MLPIFLTCRSQSKSREIEPKFCNELSLNQGSECLCVDTLQNQNLYPICEDDYIFKNYCNTVRRVYF